ncbi:MAG TPA: UDP-N-acetylmuramoylalanyl-D-glutamate--2,6-diaminopimelate ligase [Candidatus Aveggerthella stercoripullorum]|jgi:hypothetical protein|uniref:UDP-N-acetylmuramoylalanyl-D-glutamate--2, 6-diaminopimelate ligase n=1 Tax=Candidatus Aveggerthella stercoripullorum TaxID=2840688 RepID=A0A9D1A089_9ACTN|nr:UDP-N-acetylmuramoylalanyl-D-glutamate--2,6-diaminopimelate ligase [Candidatus Aveggerthella stercoripullorum]
MGKILKCPNCGETRFNLTDYDSMMVLRADVALFTLRCPGCGAHVSSLANIPADLREEVRFAAIETGAGMGCEQ